MTVRLEDITMGRCYVMADEQVRRVVEVTPNGQVRWIAHETGAGSSTPPMTSTVLKKFANEVEHEVRCEPAR